MSDAANNQGATSNDPSTSSTPPPLDPRGGTAKKHLNLPHLNTERSDPISALALICCFRPSPLFALENCIHLPTISLHRSRRRYPVQLIYSVCSVSPRQNGALDTPTDCNSNRWRQATKQ